MSQYKLKRKFVLSYLLSIAPLIIFVFLLFDQWTDIRRQTFLLRNYQLAKTIDTTVNHILNNSVTVTEILAKDPAISSLSRDSAAILFYRTIPGLPFANNLILSDKYGNIVFNSLKPDQQNTEFFSLSKKNYFKEMLLKKDTVVSNISDSADPDNPTINIASPIKDTKGNIFGSVVMEIKTSFLKNDLELPDTEINTIKVFLLDKNKDIVLSSGNDTLKANQRSAFVSDPVLKDLYDQKKAGSFDNYKNPLIITPVSGVLTPVQDYDWTVIITGSLENQIEPIAKMQNIFTLLVLANLVFAVAIITYFVRKFLSFV